jgi:hypothetical protein
MTMTEPIGAYTYQDLLTRVAIEAGCAYYGVNGVEPAMAPVNNFHDFDLVSGVVQRGIKRFIDLAPAEGWNWRKRLLELTFVPAGTGATVIDSDPARYLMPQDFSGVVTGRIVYHKNTAHGGEIELVHDNDLRRDRSCQVQTNYPSRAAILPYGVRRFELLVDPAPVAADIIEIPYQAHFDILQLQGGVATAGTTTTMTDTVLTTRGYFPDDYFNGWIITVLGGTGRYQTATVTDWDMSDSKFTFTGLSGSATPDATTVYIVQPANNYHPAGASFDTAVLGACLAQAVLDLGLDDKSGRVAEFFKVLLPAAQEMDRKIAGRSRRLGLMSNGPRDYRERTWTPITHFEP